MSLLDILSLPTYGQAFKSSKTASVLGSAIDGSASPPHKRIRLDPDSDDAPFRSSTQTSGPLKLQLMGAPAATPKNASHAEQPSNQVRAWIRALLDRRDTLPVAYDKVYMQCRYVVDVCGEGEQLYYNIKCEIDKCVSSLTKELRVDGEVGVEWASQLVECCAWFEENMHLIQSLLTYLNQSYAKPRGLESTQIYGLNRFRQYLLLDGSIDQTLSQCVKRWLTEERDNAANTPHLHRAAFASLFKHLQTHGLYGEYEDDYCRLTRDYYMAESDRLSKELGPDAFLDHIMSRIDVEVDRAKDVLSVGSWEIIRKVSEEAFCKERLHWIASSAVGALADKDDKKKLKETYELFSRVNGLAKLCNVWKSYVNRKVTAIVTDKEQDAQMVDRLLEFRDQASRTVEHCFLAQKPEGKPMTAETLQGEGTAINSSTEASSSAIPARAPNQDFVYALTDAFGTGFKSRRSKPAEMIARYLDTTLRKGQKNASDKDFEKSLDAALSLYRYTEDKDVFRTFYHRALARRLLLQKSASDDFEIAMLKKLQNNYDPEFGMGEEMFKDLALSREMMNKFNEKQPANGFARRLTVMVLKRSAWPFTVSTGTIDLPPKMQDALISFAESYKAIHSGHKLDWDHALGTATLSARFNAGEKELSVSLYQAVILLMFADGEKRSFAEIKESAGNLDDGDLRRTLQSLACGKKRVLTKSPPGKNVNDGDIFRVNAEFTDSAYKIHINSIQAKVSEEEHQKTQFSIEGERKHILDAAIVRIMKGRKEMRMQDLQNSVIDAVKKHFTPKVPDVKKRIEAMVEQEYIERTEEQNTFRYVA